MADPIKPYDPNEILTTSRAMELLRAQQAQQAENPQVPQGNLTTPQVMEILRQHAAQQANNPNPFQVEVSPNQPPPIPTITPTPLNPTPPILNPETKGFLVGNPLHSRMGVNAAEWVATKAHDVLGIPDYAPKIEEIQNELPAPLKTQFNLGEILPTSVETQMEKPVDQREGWSGFVANLLPQQEKYGTSTYAEDWMPYIGRLLNAVSSAPIAAGLTTYGQMIHQGEIKGPQDYLRNLSKAIGEGTGISEVGTKVGQVLEKEHPDFARALTAIGTGFASETGMRIASAMGLAKPDAMTLPKVLGAWGLGVDLLVPLPSELLSKGTKAVNIPERALQATEKQNTAIRDALSKSTELPPLNWKTTQTIDRNVVKDGEIVQKNNPGYIPDELLLTSIRSPELSMLHPRPEMEEALKQHFEETGHYNDPNVRYLQTIKKPLLVLDAPRAADFKHAQSVIQVLPLHPDLTPMDLAKRGIERREMDFANVMDPAHGFVGVEYRLENNVPQAKAVLTRFAPEVPEHLKPHYRPPLPDLTAADFPKDIPWDDPKYSQLRNQFMGELMDLGEKIIEEKRGYTDDEWARRNILNEIVQDLHDKVLNPDNWKNQKRRDYLNKNIQFALPQSNVVNLFPKVSPKALSEDQKGALRFQEMMKQTPKVEEEANKGTLLQGRLATQIDAKTFQAKQKILEYTKELNQDITGRGSYFEKQDVKGMDQATQQASQSLFDEFNRNLRTIPDQARLLLKGGTADNLLKAIGDNIKAIPGFDYRVEEIEDQSYKQLINGLASETNRVGLDPDHLISEARRAAYKKVEDDLKNVVNLNGQSPFPLSPENYSRLAKQTIDNIVEMVARISDNTGKTFEKFQKDNQALKLKTLVSLFLDTSKEIEAQKYFEKLVDFGLGSSGQTMKGFLDLDDKIGLNIGKVQAGKTVAQSNAEAFQDIVKRNFKDNSIDNFYQKTIEDVALQSGKSYEEIYQGFQQHDILQGILHAAEKERSADSIFSIMSSIQKQPLFRDKLVASLLGDANLKEPSSKIKQALQGDVGKNLIENLLKLDPDEQGKVLSQFNSYFSNTERILRSALTSGTLLPNLRNLTMNFLSGAGLVYQQLGGKAALGSTAHLLDGMAVASHYSNNPRLTKGFQKISRSLSDLARPVVFSKADQKIYTLGDLLDVATRANLSAGQVRFELGSKEIEQIMDLLPEIKKTLMTQALDKLGGGKNPNTWAQLNADIDLSWRVGALISSLEQGDTLSTAVLKARKSLFDFSQLSDLEKQFLSRNVFFYTWMRHNVVNTVENLMSPKGLTRVKNQLKLISSQSTDDQSLRTGKGKDALDFSKAQLKPDYHLYGPTLPTLDALDFLTELGSIPYFLQSGQAGQAKETALDVVGQQFINPYLQSLTSILSGGNLDLQNRSLAGKPDPRLIGFYKAIPGVWETFQNLFDLEPDNSKQYGIESNRKGGQYQLQSPVMTPQGNETLQSPFRTVRPETGKLSIQPLQTETNRYKFGSEQGKMFYGVFQKALIDLIAGRTMRDYEYFIDPRYTAGEQISQGIGLGTARQAPSAYEQSLSNKYNVEDRFNKQQ